MFAHVLRNGFFFLHLILLLMMPNVVAGAMLLPARMYFLLPACSFWLSTTLSRVHKYTLEYIHMTKTATMNTTYFYQEILYI